MSKSKLKISVFELVWYILCGLVAVWGLTYTVLGLIANYGPITADDTPLQEASNTIKSLFGLDFFGWGLILIGIGVILIIIVLLINAKKSDFEAEKAARRAARLVRNDVPEETPAEK